MSSRDLIIFIALIKAVRVRVCSTGVNIPGSRDELHTQFHQIHNVLLMSEQLFCAVSVRLLNNALFQLI